MDPEGRPKREPESPGSAEEPRRLGPLKRIPAAQAFPEGNRAGQNHNASRTERTDEKKHTGPAPRGGNAEYARRKITGAAPHSPGYALSVKMNNTEEEYAYDIF